MKVRSVIDATMGMAATDSADRMSDPTLTNRRPRWSTSHPATGAITRAGRALRAATRPAAAGESVRTSTSQGNAIITIELPTPEVKLATCRRITGTRQR